MRASTGQVCSVWSTRQPFHNLTSPSGANSMAVRKLAIKTCLWGLMVLCMCGVFEARAVAANGRTRANLEDYVSCQFTAEEEAKWKDDQNPTFLRTRNAAVKTLESAPATPEVKEALKTTRKAQNRVEIQAAIDKIPNAAVQDSVNRSIAAAQNPVPPALTPPSDLLCSRSLLSFNEASDIFGRRIASTYLVVQVVVRNLNQDNDYLIQDVILAAPNTKFGSGRDKLLARGVSTVGQSRDPRNLVMNGLDTLSATTGAIAQIGTSNTPITPGFQDLQSAANVLGAFIPPLKRMFPDYTVDQLNRLNDLAFSASTTYKMVVPKGGSVPFVTFVPQKALEKPVKKWRLDDFLAMDQSTYVLVAGMHIAKVPSAPVVASLSVSGGRPTDAVTITGSNFGTSQGTVKFGSTTATVTSWSTTGIVVTVPNIPTAGREDIVVSSGGADSAPNPFVVCAVSGPCITGVSPTPVVGGQSAKISGEGFAAATGTVEFGGVPVPPAAIVNWTDTSITVTVPVGQTLPTTVVVTTAAPVASSPGFPLPDK